MNDSYTGWLGPIALGAGSTLQNSQCKIDGAQSWASDSGNALTVNLAVTRLNPDSGPLSVYGWATDDTTPTGWTTLGRWVYAPDPTVMSVAPTSGSGLTQKFSFSYSHGGAAGAADIQYADMLISSGMSFTNACSTMYYPSTNALYLANDAYTAWLGPITPGAAGTVENSQCKIDGSQSSFSGGGPALNLNLAIAFKPSFAGSKTIYSYAKDTNGAKSGVTWTAIGTWMVGQ